MFPTVYPDNPYEKMLAALKDPEQFKAQLHGIADQNKALQDRLNQVATSQSVLDKSKLDLEQKAEELKKSHEDLNAKLGLHERTRAEIDTAVAALNKREADLIARERLHHDNELAFADKVKELARHHDAASAMQASAEKIQLEASKVKADYEDKVAKLKAVI